MIYFILESFNVYWGELIAIKISYGFSWSVPDLGKRKTLLGLNTLDSYYYNFSSPFKVYSMLIL